MKWYRPPEYYRASRWRGTWPLDGGGAVMNQGIHTLDLGTLHLLGDVAAVSARAGALRHAIEVEDTGGLSPSWSSGAGRSGPTKQPPPPIPGTSGAWRSRASAGPSSSSTTAWWPPTWRRISPFAGAPPAAAVGESASSHVVSDPTPHRRIFEDFLRALREGTRPICDGREGQRSIDLVEAIYTSSRTGTAVPL